MRALLPFPGEEAAQVRVARHLFRDLRRARFTQRLAVLIETARAAATSSIVIPSMYRSTNAIRSLVGRVSRMPIAALQGVASFGIGWRALDVRERAGPRQANPAADPAASKLPFEDVHRDGQNERA